MMRCWGYGRGYGFRGESPPWPYVGVGRGGRPRCHWPGLNRAWGVRPGGGRPFRWTWSGADEIEALRQEAEALRRVEARLADLEGKGGGASVPGQEGQAE